jgi:hypothetical protein
MSEPYICECGAKILTNNISRHKKTKQIFINYLIHNKNEQDYIR